MKDKTSQPLNPIQNNLKEEPLHNVVAPLINKIMKNIKKYIVIFIIITSHVLVSCQNIPENDIQSASETQKESPTINIGSTELSYPPPENNQSLSESYPIENSEINISNRGPDFIIYEPIKGGDKIIHGSGPAGVPLILIDVSTGGIKLGTTTIKKNGEFEFQLKDSVKSGHSIGIQLGDISGTDLNPNDYIYNENYYDRPLVGILFDMIIVQ